MGALADAEANSGEKARAAFGGREVPGKIVVGVDSMRVVLEADRTFGSLGFGMATSAKVD